MKLLLLQGRADLTIVQHLSAIKLIWGSPSTVPEWHDWSHSALGATISRNMLTSKSACTAKLFYDVASSITLRTVNREPAASGFTCERSINDHLKYHVKYMGYSLRHDTDHDFMYFLESQSALSFDQIGKHLTSSLTTPDC
jgi:hypothetical protein